MSDELDPLWRRIEERMGVCPSFFRLARHEPAIAWGLFGLAEFAYLDSPIPSRFKERLFTYLSRFCPVPYCMARHCAFLLGRGSMAGDLGAGSLSLDEARALLGEPLPDGPDLERCLAVLERESPAPEAWPSWRSEGGLALRVAAGQVFLHAHRATRWISALQRFLGRRRYEQLMLFLAFVRTAHFWTEVHPELQTEADVEALLAEYEELAESLTAATREGAGQHSLARLHSELDELRRRAEATRQIRQLADSLPAFIAYIGHDYRFQFANRAYVEAFASPARDLVGSPVDEVLGDAAHREVRQHLDAALRGSPARFDRRLRLADRGERELDVSYVPDRRADGSVAGCFEMAFDVTERKRAERVLRDSDRRKDEYLAMLGHELRNPLAAIQNAGELVRLVGGSDERLERAAAVLARQTAHMTRLVDDLLEVSRIARGKVRLVPEILDLGPLCTQVVEDHREEVHRRGLELEKSLPSCPVWASADRVRLVQVLENLLGNAVKFTPAPGRITLLLEVAAGTAVLSVRDTGIGIASARLEEIFEPFHQEEQQAARERGGLGLGLAVARGLVALHGGTIQAQSDGAGKGTTVSVRLPLAEEPPAAPAAESGATAPARAVLVVEDNADAAQMLADHQRLGGHRVDVASTGPQAMEALRREPFDVVLCDIGLPGMSGHELARAVRADEALRHVVLVAVTGYGQPDDRTRTSEAGFDAHLTKPVDLPSLKRVLSTRR